MFYGLVPSVDGREMYIYYVGSDHLHGWGRDEKNNRLLTHGRPAADPGHIHHQPAGLCAATASSPPARPIRAASSPPPPLVFSGSKLMLNIDTSATGIAQVGILDEAGKPIEGFSVDQCDRIHTCNEINRVVSWKRQSDVSKLAGQTVRLRFVMRDCDLYAFQFGK